MEGDAVMTQLKAMFPAIATQKVRQHQWGTDQLTPRRQDMCFCGLTGMQSTSHDENRKCRPHLQDLLAALIQDRAHAKFYRPPAARFSAATRMWARLKAALLLVAVAWSLPLSLLAVAGSVLSEWAALAARGGGAAEARRRAQRGLQGKTATTALRGTAIVSGGARMHGTHTDDTHLPVYL